VLRLLGDSGTEGSLLGAVRRQPFSVVLLDELEKADASFFDLLLQVLGEGRLTGADGHTVNFCGTLVLMTSNLGAQALQRSPMAMVASTEDPRRHFEQAVQAALRPELFNRIDHVVPYAVLSGAQRVPIFEREIALMRQREGLRERQITLSLDVGTAAHLATLPGDARYGARDVQRVLRQQVLLPLAHAVAPHAAVQAISVQISPQDGVLKVRTDVLQQPLDSAPLRVAQAAAQARRRWQQAADGPLVVYLANQAFSLEREHQRHNKKRHKLPTLPHWDETAQAHRQRTLKGVRTRFDALQRDILLLDDEALQALMGERSEPPSLVPWEARFAALKQEVFSASRPGSNLCTLGLYGPRPLLDTLLITWTELFHLTGFKVRIQVVSLRDPKAKMGLAPPPPPARPESVDEDEVAAPPEPPPVYVREDWPLPPGKSLPTQSVIAGFEIEVKGAAVFDYLSGEAGMWRVFEGQHKSDLWVAVRNQALDDFETPWGVHRRLFFSDKTVHRQIKEACLSDAAGQWRVDWPQVQLWKALLDRHMGHTIDRLLLGQTEESNA
jgi:AAA domain (Cdc48 subfamily)/C-terminal, D2-small domain, of ClpB protein